MVVLVGSVPVLVNTQAETSMVIRETVAVAVAVAVELVPVKDVVVIITLLVVVVAVLAQREILVIRVIQVMLETPPPLIAYQFLQGVGTQLQQTAQ